MMIRMPNASNTPLFDEHGRLFKTGDAIMIDCREIAPAASHPHMFETTSSVNGGLSIAVPGELHCLHVAHANFGRLPWKELFDDAINLARNGFALTSRLAGLLQTDEKYILATPALASVYAPQGQILKAGDIVYRKRFADTLEKIANEGISVLYTGPIAESLIKTISAAGGIMTLQDLANYKPILRRPLVGSYRGFKITTPPPPSSGAILISMLNIVERFNISTIDASNVHILVEAIKYGTVRLYLLQAQRTLLSDPQSSPSVNQHANKFIDKSTSARLPIDDRKTYDPAHYAFNEVLFGDVEEHGTCHISVMGRFNDDVFEAVSITTTNNFPFGSFVVDQNSGIILNNEMDDFSNPKKRNAIGNMNNPLNFPYAGHKPLSSMIPTLLESKDKAIVIGASGGSKIFSSVFQAIVGVIDWGLTAGMGSSYIQSKRSELRDSIIHLHQIELLWRIDGMKGLLMSRKGWKNANMTSNGILIYHPWFRSYKASRIPMNLIPQRIRG